MPSKNTIKKRLLDPRWQKMKLNIFKRDDFKCKICGNGGNIILQHLDRKGKFKNPWDYPDYYMITICSACHPVVKKFYLYQEQLKRVENNINLPL